MEDSMTVQLPESANLEHLKGQAKTLLQQLRANEPEALTRIAGLPATPPYRLSEAQLAVAREYGFESWAKLKRHVTGFTTRRDALFASIRAGDHGEVQKLLKADSALVHSRNPAEFGSTTLTAAVNRNDIPIIDLLLEFGANPEARSDWWAGGFGPLDFGSDATSDHLLSRGAKLTAHAAARLGRAKELQEILDRNPDVIHERGGDGQFPLHFSKTPEIVDILVDAGSDLEARDIDHEGTALQFQIKNERVAKRLFERGARLDVFSAIILDQTAALEKILDEDPEAVSRGINQPGNPDIPVAPGSHIYTYTLGFSQPHQVATHFGRWAAYDVLWAKSPPAMRVAMAAWRGDRDAALKVVEETPGVVTAMRPEDMQMLPAAAWNRRISVVRLFLELGFDPNVQDGEGMTAIARGSFHGFADIVEAILPFKPDLTIQNVYGGTPLTTSLYGSVNGWRKDGDYAKTLELLIAAGSPLPDHVRGSAAAQAVLRKHGVPEASPSWPPQT